LFEINGLAARVT